MIGQSFLHQNHIPSSLGCNKMPNMKRKFPPKVKLLTEDEYHEQGVKETAKALKELREYCSSPECDPWNTMLKLKHPLRFASFIKGTSHLSDDEILEYESESRRLEYYTDDSDEEY